MDLGDLNSGTLEKKEAAAPVSARLAFQPGVVGSKPTTTTLIATIERGKAAQRALDRAAAQTWAHWRDICLALLAIQRLAMAAAKADQPRGAPYHRAINYRLRLHGFDRYDKAARSRMVELARNLDAIETWRATLPEERLSELNFPRIVLTAWKQSLSLVSSGGRQRDKKKDAPPPVDAALRASSGWDVEIWQAVLAAKSFDWFQRVMPSAWRPQLQQRAGEQFMRLEQKRAPNKRLKNWKPAVVAGTDTMGAAD
jgi:hypothetical protein